MYAQKLNIQKHLKLYKLYVKLNNGTGLIS